MLGKDPFAKPIRVFGNNGRIALEHFNAFITVGITTDHCLVVALESVDPERYRNNVAICLFDETCP